MAIDIDELIAELKVFAPDAVEVPRDPDTNAVRESTITRWAEEGAARINECRGKTTIKQTTITTVADQQDYDLPADARTVTRIMRQRIQRTGSEIWDVPTQNVVIGAQPGGYLPSGQEIGGALDLIGRQRLERSRREDDWELFEGKIRLLFPVDADETIRVEYKVVDRTLDSLPADYFDMLLGYVTYRNIDWFLGRHGAGIVVTGDSFANDSMIVLNRRKAELEARWLNDLNSIAPEAA